MNVLWLCLPIGLTLCGSYYAALALVRARQKIVARATGLALAALALAGALMNCLNGDPRHPPVNLIGILTCNLGALCFIRFSRLSAQQFVSLRGRMLLMSFFLFFWSCNTAGVVKTSIMPSPDGRYTAVVILENNQILNRELSTIVLRSNSGMERYLGAEEVAQVHMWQYPTISWQDNHCLEIKSGTLYDYKIQKTEWKDVTIAYTSR